MHKFIIICLLFLFSISIKGQKYISCFGDNSTKWTEIVSNEYPMSLELIIDKSLIVGGINYKSINNGEYLLRQDSLNSKLYILNKDYSDSEYIIMDLNLNKGDTFKLLNLHLQKNIIVDSIYYINNRKVVEFDYYLWTNYSSGSEKFRFIEGYGSNMGVTYQYDIFMHDFPYLLCYQNDTSAYLSKFFKSCEFSWVNINNKELNKIKIQQNPVIDYLDIKVDDNMSYNLRIISLSGTTIKRLKISSNVRIGVDSLNKGIYILELIDNNGKILTQKIIKI